MPLNLWGTLFLNATVALPGCSPCVCMAVNNHSSMEEQDMPLNRAEGGASPILGMKWYWSWQEEQLAIS